MTKANRNRISYRVIEFRKLQQPIHKKFGEEEFVATHLSIVGQDKRSWWKRLFTKFAPIYRWEFIYSNCTTIDDTKSKRTRVACVNGKGICYYKWFSDIVHSHALSITAPSGNYLKLLESSEPV